jgi:hypothetical protein
MLTILPPPLSSIWRIGPAAVHVPHHIGAHERGPVRVGGLEERAYEQPSGIVDPDVEAAELVSGKRREVVGRRRIAGVGLHQHAALAERFDRRHGLGGRRPLLLVAVRAIAAGDVGAGACERDGRGLADALGRAGDDRDTHSERYSMVCRWPVSCERTIASQISAQR